MGLDQIKSQEPKVTDKKGADKEAPPPKTATLEVTPKQAEIIAVAADLGVLSISLRSLGRANGDEATDPPSHTWDSEAAQGLLAGPASDHPRRTGPAQPWSRVVVVRGGAVTEMMMSPRSLKAPPVIP
jgi:pilus assembly protein CpaB